MDKIIRVKNRSAATIPWQQLRPFQGDLKEINKLNFEKLKKSIFKHGITKAADVWAAPDGEYKCIDGHQRLKLYEWLENKGWTVPPIPVSFVEAASESEAKEILLTHAGGSYGTITEQGLMDYMKGADLNLDFLNEQIVIPEIDMEAFEEKFKTTTVKEHERRAKGEDDVPEVRKDPKTKLGDVWCLGRHRLMCGDATSGEALQTLLDGERADFCFTSPPYADQRTYEGGKKLDTEYLAEFLKVECDLFAVNLGISRKDYEIIPYWDDYIKAAKKYGHKLLSWNVWDRAGDGVSIGQATAMFMIDHEWIFVFGKYRKLNRTVENKTAGQSMTAVNRNADGSQFRRKAMVGSHKQLSTVIKSGKSREGLHPAMFPVSLPEQYIEACTDKKDVVYEPFGGAGSTLIACEKTDRNCLVMELEPIYVRVIIDRWEAFTGQKAELIS